MSSEKNNGYNLASYWLSQMYALGNRNEDSALVLITRQYLTALFPQIYTWNLSTQKVSGKLCHRRIWRWAKGRVKMNCCNKQNDLVAHVDSCEMDIDKIKDEVEYTFEII